MSEKVTKKKLRELTLWGKEEPEKLSEGLVKELSLLIPSWKIKELKEEDLEQEVSIPPTSLSEKQIAELKEIVGENNLNLDAITRIMYSHGGAGEDLIRVRTANFSLLTEAVVHPETEEQIIAVMKFCEKNNLSLIVVGGRTGVTRATNLSKKGITIDLRPHFTKIIHFDKEQLLVRVQTGILGPELEDYLQRRGCTLGHFPQSFEQSSVGGWIASRSAGQNSSLVGKIEDMVISLRVCTPQGIVESHLSPARATGPQWFRYFIGSEGTLGIITEAVLKIRTDETRNRKFASFMFPSFQDGINAMREIYQGEFIPAIGRLSCGNETQAYLLLNREGKVRLKDKLIEFILKTLKFYPMRRAVFLTVFEGSKEYVKKAKKRVKKIALRHKGLPAGGSYSKKWFEDRFEHPHLRDSLLDKGLIVDTLETASTWDNISILEKKVKEEVKDICPLTIAHLSHSYPSGSAIYFTFFMPLEKNKGLEQIRELQKRVITTFQKNGGVVSHHHGIGKAFKEWGKKEWGETALKMAEGVKKELDPDNILNPDNFPF